MEEVEEIRPSDGIPEIVFATGNRFIRAHNKPNSGLGVCPFGHESE